MTFHRCKRSAQQFPLYLPLWRVKRAVARANALSFHSARSSTKTSVCSDGRTQILQTILSEAVDPGRWRRPPTSSSVVTWLRRKGIRSKFIFQPGQNAGASGVVTSWFPRLLVQLAQADSSLVEAGYRVVAPDLRGVGESEAPDSVESYSEFHCVGDIIGLLDSLKVQEALLVTHDWGATYGADLALFRPDRVKALVLLDWSYIPRVQDVFAVDLLRKMLGNDTYISVFQRPGVAEALFKEARTEDVFSTFYLRWNSTPNVAIPPFIENEPLPDWLTKEDMKTYAEVFDKCRWTGALNQYRAMKLSWELKTPWTKAALPSQVPVILVIGRQDVGAAFFGIKNSQDEEAYFTKCKESTPGLKVGRFIDASHFLHQEKPEEVNKLILDFLEEYKTQA